MVYIFVFVGEFGYELLNWQGVIRKFSGTIDRRKDKIVCASRKGLNILYESSDLYIDISELHYFKNSVASMYEMRNPDINLYKKHDEVIAGKLQSELKSEKNVSFVIKAEREIKQFIDERLNWQEGFQTSSRKYVFSSSYVEINGVEFGLAGHGPNIYRTLPLNNNKYIKINPDCNHKSAIECKLGFPLNDDYILCQDAKRNVVVRSDYRIQKKKLVYDIACYRKIVLLDFNTGRNMDSCSKFIEEWKDVSLYRYVCDSLAEQAILIKYAKCCLFFTEGDFRSHNYIPPFIGKNVISIASRDIFKLPSAPIEFWNRNVFNFGGQIIPFPAEDLEDNLRYKELLKMVM